jgi:hypothetical protein
VYLLKDDLFLRVFGNAIAPDSEIDGVFLNTATGNASSSAPSSSSTTATHTAAAGNTTQQQAVETAGSFLSPLKNNLSGASHALKHLREMASDIAVKTTVTIGGQNNFAHRRLNEEVMILLYLILLPIVYCI